MIDPQEIEKIEAIESKLLAEEMPFSEIVQHYANFLLSLVQGNRLSNFISARERFLIVTYLKKALTINDPQLPEATTKTILARLWRIEKITRKYHRTLSGIIRCVICCFGSEDEWLQGDLDDATPLYIFLFFLKKANPDLGQDFLFYFQEI